MSSPLTKIVKDAAPKVAQPKIAVATRHAQLSTQNPLTLNLLVIRRLKR
jgi:hypothetical protein